MTIANILYSKLSKHTVAFNVPKHKVEWSNQYGKKYVFPDDSYLLLQDLLVSYADHVQQDPLQTKKIAIHL